MGSKKPRSKVGGASRELARAAAQNAYRKRGEKTKIPDGLQEIYSSDTIRAYRNPQTGDIQIGARGTADLRDVSAWLPTAFGRLNKTSRYKEDVKQVEELAARYPDAKFEFSGHSLGGAIASQLRRDLREKGYKTGDVKGYNAARQPQDNLDTTDSDMYYTKGDPLGRTMGYIGSFFNKSGTHYEDSNKRQPSSYVPGILKPAFNALQAHGMDNFDAPAPTTTEKNPNASGAQYKDPLTAFGLTGNGMY